MIERIVYGISPPRTGTTWLARRIGAHSRVRRNLKEVHYFDSVYPIKSEGSGWRFGIEHRKSLLQTRAKKLADRAKRRWRRRAEFKAQSKLIEDFLSNPLDDAAYERSFAAGPGDWCMDVTPSYWRLSEEGHAHMRRIAERVELVLLLREPVERTLSAMRLLHSHGKIDLTTTDSERLCRLARAHVAAADYPSSIDRLRARFGAENVHHFWFDDIIERPEGLVVDVLACLDLEIEAACMADAEASPNSTEPVPVSDEVVDTIVRECRPITERLDHECGPVPERWCHSLKVGADL